MTCGRLKLLKHPEYLTDQEFYLWLRDREASLGISLTTLGQIAERMAHHWVSGQVLHLRRVLAEVRDVADKMHSDMGAKRNV